MKYVIFISTGQWFCKKQLKCFADNEKEKSIKLKIKDWSICG